MHTWSILFLYEKRGKTQAHVDNFNDLTVETSTEITMISGNIRTFRICLEFIFRKT
jgi:hypothetical protein